MEPKKGKYLIVTNLTADPLFIAPDSRGSGDNLRSDLSLMPHVSLTVRPDEWEDDGNLERCIERGWAKMEWSDKRAKVIPTRPKSAETGNPYLNNMIYEIVFGKEENARGFISAEKRFLDRAGQPIDREWTKNTLWNCLEGAREWLQLWGPPAEFSWRIQAINERLEEIRMMP